MKVLLDQNIPRLLKPFLQQHVVLTARQMGWDRLGNGDLLTAAEESAFQLFITADGKLRYQQNLTLRKIAIIEVSNNNWPSMQPHVPRIVAAVDTAQPGTYLTIDYPYIYQPKDRTP